ncbi:MAG: glutamate mutase L, partial [Ktedonobacteraceae bacterium]|nr:glutamate mutase L [Ktedonobacteraceae bacterium]
MVAQPQPVGGQGAAQESRQVVPGSLLVADCGAVFTKVSLFGLVEGQYRLMARGEVPTSIKPPQEDITAGILQAIRTIEFITGRRFIENAGEDERLISPERPDGNGIDAFVTVISAGGPLRLVVLGAVSKQLEQLVEQAVSGLYVETHSLPAPSFVVATSSPAPVPAAAGAGSSPSHQGVQGAWTQERIAMEWERHLSRLRELQPQAALIVGMADGPAGPAPLQEACQLLINAAREREEQAQTNLMVPRPRPI